MVVLPSSGPPAGRAEYMAASHWKKRSPLFEKAGGSSATSTTYVASGVDSAARSAGTDEFAGGETGAPGSVCGLQGGASALGGAWQLRRELLWYRAGTIVGGGSGAELFSLTGSKRHDRRGVWAKL